MKNKTEEVAGFNSGSFLSDYVEKGLGFRV